MWGNNLPSTVENFNYFSYEMAKKNGLNVQTNHFDFHIYSETSLFRTPLGQIKMS